MSPELKSQLAEAAASMSPEECEEAVAASMHNFPDPGAVAAYLKTLGADEGGGNPY